MRRFNKYGSQKTSCKQGHVHGSKREATRCNELSMLEVAGHIEKLEQQPQFWFTINGRALTHKNGRRVGYKADFRYVENGRDTVEEVKGFVVRDWPLRRAVFCALYPEINLKET